MPGELGILRRLDAISAAPVAGRTRKVIEHGRRIRVVLGQRQLAPLALGEEVALLAAVADGVLDELPLDRLGAFRAGLAPWLGQHCPDILALDDRAAALSEELRARLKAALSALARTVAAAPAAGEGKGP